MLDFKKRNHSIIPSDAEHTISLPELSCVMIFGHAVGTKSSGRGLSKLAHLGNNQDFVVKGFT